MLTHLHAGGFTLADMATFSERLREAAKEAGLDHRQLAAKMGMGRSNMHHWWNDKTKKPQGDAVAEAANILGVNARWLAAGVGPKRLSISPSATAPRIEQGHTDPGPILGKEELVMNLNMSADQMVRAWLALPENARNRFKREIETLALQYLEDVPDSRLTHLAAKKKTTHD